MPKPSRPKGPEKLITASTGLKKPQPKHMTENLLSGGQGDIRQCMRAIGAGLDRTGAQGVVSTKAWLSLADRGTQSGVLGWRGIVGSYPGKGDE